MNNDSTKAELIERIKKMPENELLAYETAAVNTNRCINALGVVFLFFMLSYSSLLVILPCAILIYILAKIGTGIGITIREIRIALTKFDK